VCPYGVCVACVHMVCVWVACIRTGVEVACVHVDGAQRGLAVFEITLQLQCCVLGACACACACACGCGCVHIPNPTTLIWTNLPHI
jgi:hypothetical protein